MAKDTLKSLSHQVIYQVYPRNHSDAGTFAGVVADLDRIKDLGVDILYLLPVHPIGETARKGMLGSPYSIKDYRSINPELGSVDDFKTLINEAHDRGLKVMMDLVMNHTSRDHRWIQTHPEYYYINKEGNMGNKVGDWSDIQDLDYNHLPLWDEMIDMLKEWVRLGVDGFRCDVAPFVPIEFWIKARNEIKKLNPDHIWLAESVHKEFLRHMRDEGFLCHSDGEMYAAFDVCYDYDIFQEVEDYFKGKRPLSAFIDRLQLQDMIYPMNYLKARAYENHDVQRLMHQTKNDVYKTKNWVAAIFGLKGLAFLYAGIETLTDRLPNLFDKDPVDWAKLDKEFTQQIKNLIKIKKLPIVSEYTKYRVIDDGLDILHIEYHKNDERLIFLCNVSQVRDDVKIDFPSGEHINLFDGKTVRVAEGFVRLTKNPIILHQLS